jgi:hypothetical protein
VSELQQVLGTLLAGLAPPVALGYGVWRAARETERNRWSGRAFLFNVINGIAIVLLAAATVAVLIALPAAIATVVAAVALAYVVTDVSDRVGVRSNERRAAQRAAGEDEPRPDTAAF